MISVFKYQSMVNKLKKTFNSLGHTFKKLRLLAVACVISQVKKYFNYNYFISVFIYQLMINKPKNKLFKSKFIKKRSRLGKFQKGSTNQVKKQPFKSKLIKKIAVHQSFIKFNE